MTAFEKMARKPPKCDICGGTMNALYGIGFDTDRIVCVDVFDCGAEIVFPTSTEFNGNELMTRITKAARRLIAAHDRNEAT